jgi:hypothetical protein
MRCAGTEGHTSRAPVMLHRTKPALATARLPGLHNPFNHRRAAPNTPRHTSPKFCSRDSFAHRNHFVATQQNRLTIALKVVDSRLCSAAKRQTPGKACRHLDPRTNKFYRKQHLIQNLEISAWTTQRQAQRHRHGSPGMRCEWPRYRASRHLLYQLK